eukprot:COSAG03_NODE_28303_length_204_cov_21.819048_1_plen_35_part_01
MRDDLPALGDIAPTRASQAPDCITRRQIALDYKEI